MKPILLVTMWGDGNFGNKLQVIALKHMIEEKKYTTTISVYGFKIGFFHLAKRNFQIYLGSVGVSKYRKGYLYFIREKAIKSSSDILLNNKTDTIYDFGIEDKIDSSDYVAAIVGSDQVWHGWYNSLSELPYFYLSFMPKEKRISYAASFGFDIFPEKDKEAHEHGLKGMRFISCREENGCELVRQVTGVPGELVLDPALCVDRSYWETMEEKPYFIQNEKYLLLFMLGSDSSYISKIKQYANDHDLIIVNLFDYSDSNVWRTTIGGFLWLIHHAEIICTDSFHCTAFSIIFHRKITVFRRMEREMDGMFNRLETLLKIANMEHVIYSGDYIVDTIPDYVAVGSKLQPHIEKSKQWLFSALKETTMNIS